MALIARQSGELAPMFCGFARLTYFAGEMNGLVLR
jgi:hypothetical protein